MHKRTLAVLAVAAAAGAVFPFGLPKVAQAAVGYNSISIKPLPLEQPGGLSPSGTNTVTACIQPLSGGHVVAGAQVYLSIDPGLFTAPPAGGGSATAEGTPLTGTPTQFTVQASCNYSNKEGSGTLMQAIPVTYTGPAPTVPVNGRDVIAATSDGTSFNATTGACTGPGFCNTGTYVFSPVTSYTFSPPAPIAPPGSLAAGAKVTFNVTAVDATSHPVPGAFIDLQLSSTAASGGTATGVNSFDGNLTQKVTSDPGDRFGATNSGTVAVTYTAANPLPTAGTDTITAKNHPTATVTATTSYTYGSTGPFTQAPYTAITPFRVCDTRPAGGGIPSNQCNGAGKGAIGQGQVRAVTIEGQGVVPASGVTAVVVNVTAIAPTKGTFVTVFPAGVPVPRTSNINPTAGAVIANLVEVGVGTGGQIDVFNDLGTINVALDVEGYVSSTSPGFFNPANPTRICDTRVGAGIPNNQCNSNGTATHPITSSSPLTFNVSSSGSPIPPSGVTAVVFNLTAIAPSARTVLAAAPGDVSVKPNVSNININAGAAVPNRVIVAVPSGCSGNCTVHIWNNVGSVNVAVDVDGWFGTASAAQFTALSSPARVCDTQTGTSGTGGCPAGMVPARGVLNIFVDGVDGIPPLTGPHTPVAIVANVTAVNATTGTFVTVFPGPGTATRPNASDLNAPTFEPVTNLVVVEVGSDGSINLFNDLGNVNLIVDVLGFYS